RRRRALPRRTPGCAVSLPTIPPASLACADGTRIINSQGIGHNTGEQVLLSAKHRFAERFHAAQQVPMPTHATTHRSLYRCTVFAHAAHAWPSKFMPVVPATNGPQMSVITARQLLSAPGTS